MASPPPFVQCAWPPPAHLHRAALLEEELNGAWEKFHLDPALLRQKDVQKLVASVGGNSPYLADLCCHHPDIVHDFALYGPDALAPRIFKDMAAINPDGPSSVVTRALRLAKQRTALTCALADIGSFWGLEAVTHTLSLLADTALDVATRHLLLLAHKAGQITLQNPERPHQGSGFVVLAVGKLGAKELNFSSDIDLIILYDPECYPGHDNLRQVFVRMAADLASFMEKRDAYGYVFRTDLRLRPDPAATPLAVSFPAAITYYESLGQTWERAALTKARVVAGDRERGAYFLECIRPFIWRRHLDFTVIDDILEMKQRIDRHKDVGNTDLATLGPDIMRNPEKARDWLLGHSLKLGHGGIREVEFIAQTLQLVWGGRNPELRDPTTLGALRLLTERGHLAPAACRSLDAAYHLLRHLEHRLQMQDDRQTHSLPPTAETFEQFARFAGYASGGALAVELLAHMQSVRLSFDNIFATPGEDHNHDIILSTDDLPQRVIALGLPREAANILSTWSGNGLRALRSGRARDILRRILPALLQAFARQREPITVLRRFDTLLAHHGAGVALLSLFERNPLLIQRIATILGGSAFLADYLAETPAALEGLLTGSDMHDIIASLPQTIAAMMRDDCFEDESFSALRRFLRGQEFLLCVGQMEGRIGVDKAGHIRTATAEAILSAMLRHVKKQHQARYGRLRGGEFAIIALGKAGSNAMMAGSDLDLMLVFDHPDGPACAVPPATRRKRGALVAPSLPAGQYFVRLAHALISAISAPDVQGPLYPVDMRLRPSGSKGPVAISLPAFYRYHQESAWTWERMAITRARMIAGSPRLRPRVRQAVAESFARAAPRDTLLRDAARMRALLRKERPPTGPWDVKHRDGGLMEVEFIAQILQLAAQDTRVRHTETGRAIALLEKHGFLAQDDALLLREADRFWRAIQAMLRILHGTTPPPRAEDISANPARSEALLRGIAYDVGDIPSCTALLERMDDTARKVRDSFIRLVGPLVP